jgi:UTP--glucose-1-phosphate uridylyltransferase
MRGLITLAGEGSRMLPWTRGARKELLPLYDRGVDGAPMLKPVANLALETLVRAGLADVVLVVGGADGGASVQSYFTVDRAFLARHAHHARRLANIARVYHTLQNVRLRFAVQPEPAGFGEAVLRAQPFLGHEPFLLHAGDAVLLEQRRGEVPALLGRLLERDGLDAVLLVRRVANPTNYGVVEGRLDGREGGLRRLRVTGMEEKPRHPRSPWAATAVYAFSPRIFEALRTVHSEDPATELELTSGIRRLLSEGASVSALVLDPKRSEWRSVGSPEGYRRAMNRTYAIARSGRAFGAPVEDFEPALIRPSPTIAGTLGPGSGPLIGRSGPAGHRVAAPVVTRRPRPPRTR